MVKPDISAAGQQQMPYSFSHFCPAGKITFMLSPGVPVKSEKLFIFERP